MSTSGADRDIKVGFVGTFEVTNYGDCLFPVVYRMLLEQRLPHCEFTYHSPRESGASPLGEYGPIKALPSKLDGAQFDEDCLILCGGETLSLGHSAGTYNFPSSTLSAYARMWLGPTFSASRGGPCFFVHSVGMPTVNFDDAPAIARGLQHASRISLRDAVSARRLDDTFPVEVDPMFAMSTCQSQDDWKTTAQAVLPDGFVPGNYLCAQVSAPYLRQGLRPWCEQVVAAARASDLPILLLPICHFLWDRETLEAARTTMVEMGMVAEQVCFPKPGYEKVLTTAALLGNSASVITSSLHALVSAVSFGVPFAGFGGAGKADGKHRQTLVAAGVQFGVSTEIDTLAETLSTSRSKDMVAARDGAIKRSLADFDKLVEALRSHAPAQAPMSQELIAELIEIDLRPTRNFGHELKRMALRILKQSPTIAKALRSRRQAMLFRDVAGKSL